MHFISCCYILENMQQMNKLCQPYSHWFPHLSVSAVIYCYVASQRNRARTERRRGGWAEHLRVITSEIRRKHGAVASGKRGERRGRVGHLT